MGNKAYSAKDLRDYIFQAGTPIIVYHPSPTPQIHGNVIGININVILQNAFSTA